ncbi:MAG TPA: hypothetical protein VHX65_08620 [Pirellulales bacterium]|jgi:hypothetical protein|nr:hypothetical protein [Pirellulales bacterium]
MKRITLLLSLGLGILVVAGCNDVKRKIVETGRGTFEHALSKTAGDVQDKADEGVNKGEASVTGADKKNKDRNALNGKDDDSDK